MALVVLLLLLLLNCCYSFWLMLADCANRVCLSATKGQLFFTFRFCVACPLSFNAQTTIIKIRTTSTIFPRYHSYVLFIYTTHTHVAHIETHAYNTIHVRIFTHAMYKMIDDSHRMCIHVWCIYRWRIYLEK